MPLNTNLLLCFYVVKKMQATMVDKNQKGGKIMRRMKDESTDYDIYSEIYDATGLDEARR